MQSPETMNVIQIEITNACSGNCSNCTRLVGHHTGKTTFFMDFDFFKKAVDSMVGFPEKVGIMGGEPTLHPEFPRFLEYFASKIPIKQRGLWSSLHKKYYEHFDIIQSTFLKKYQFLNDHKTPSLHQPILIAAEDIVKDSELMWKLIDDCWVQKLWSASITPKGAFFCEVAAAMDMLFDGPGGWEVKDGWWKIKPSDPEFQAQVKRWCKQCGAAIPLERRLTNETIDDVSVSNLERLKTIGSPKIAKGQYNLFLSDNYDPSKYKWHPNAEWYIRSKKDRMSDENKNKMEQMENKKP